MRSKLYPFAFLLLSTAAAANPDTGSIQGNAEPDSQIVVTNLDDGSITGIMAKCDGTYIAANLKPGRYRIQQNGPGHAARTLSVAAGHVSETDLAPEKRTLCGKKD